MSDKAQAREKRHPKDTGFDYGDGTPVHDGDIVYKYWGRSFLGAAAPEFKFHTVERKDGGRWVSG